MVDLMNVFAKHVNLTWGREAGIKASLLTNLPKLNDHTF